MNESIMKHLKSVRVIDSTRILPSFSLTKFNHPVREILILHALQDHVFRK